MRDHLNPLFAEAGLQPGEFDVLATLRRSGDPYMLSPTRLYEAAMISSGGMTNRIDRLEQAGLVERRLDPNDRRGKLIALTATGRRVIDETIPVTPPTRSGCCPRSPPPSRKSSTPCSRS
jgi:DNA-binding MarR family transcriptional regulator